MATDTVFIYTMNRGVQGGAWGRYVFPWTIEHFTHLENTLYMRHGDDVSFAVEGGLDDDGNNFPGVIQWPWLDFGQPGVDKHLEGFDIISKGTSSIQFGTKQTDLNAFTPLFAVPVDTVEGEIIPTPIDFPSLSVKLTYDGGFAWQWNALSLWLQEEEFPT